MQLKHAVPRISTQVADVPARLERLVDTLLAKSEEQSFASAEELLRSLAPLTRDRAGGLPDAAVPEVIATPAPQGRGSASRRLLPVPLVLVLGLGAWLGLRAPGERSDVVMSVTSSASAALAPEPPDIDELGRRLQLLGVEFAALCPTSRPSPAERLSIRRACRNLDEILLDLTRHLADLPGTRPDARWWNEIGVLSAIGDALIRNGIFSPVSPYREREPELEDLRGVLQSRWKRLIESMRAPRHAPTGSVVAQALGAHLPSPGDGSRGRSMHRRITGTILEAVRQLDGGSFEDRCFQRGFAAELLGHALVHSQQLRERTDIFFTQKVSRGSLEDHLEGRILDHFERSLEPCARQRRDPWGDLPAFVAWEVLHRRLVHDEERAAETRSLELLQRALERLEESSRMKGPEAEVAADRRFLEARLRSSGP